MGDNITVKKGNIPVILLSIHKVEVLTPDLVEYGQSEKKTYSIIYNGKRKTCIRDTEEHIYNLIEEIKIGMPDKKIFILSLHGFSHFPWRRILKIVALNDGGLTAEEIALKDFQFWKKKGLFERELRLLLKKGYLTKEKLIAENEVESWVEIYNLTDKGMKTWMEIQTSALRNEDVQVGTLHGKSAPQFFSSLLATNFKNHLIKSVWNENLSGGVEIKKIKNKYFKNGVFPVQLEINFELRKTNPEKTKKIVLVAIDTVTKYLEVEKKLDDLAIVNIDYERKNVRSIRLPRRVIEKYSIETHKREYVIKTGDLDIKRKISELNNKSDLPDTLVIDVDNCPEDLMSGNIVRITMGKKNEITIIKIS